jgi:hypothetical protein
VMDNTDCPALAAHPLIDQCLLSRTGTCIRTRVKRVAVVGLTPFVTNFEGLNVESLSSEFVVGYLQLSPQFLD